MIPQLSSLIIAVMSIPMASLAPAVKKMFSVLTLPGLAPSLFSINRATS
eukprot:CAMPEP_0196189068 /NCGR_PEP_ID=MMETSP0911-20130528/43534_1 /TAXON_ID=49265 /ORGANISM="Thalassiosira rotula, Strain GSO102" /LENGTH=48 /DNA_ID= /DNA_START= /DNA_END= /DNA_ORIENTATION=